MERIEISKNNGNTKHIVGLELSQSYVGLCQMFGSKQFIRNYTIEFDQQVSFKVQNPLKSSHRHVLRCAREHSTHPSHSTTSPFPTTHASTATASSTTSSNSSSHETPMGPRPATCLPPRNDSVGCDVPDCDSPCLLAGSVAGGLRLRIATTGLWR